MGIDTQFSHLTTPCLLLDEARMDNNIRAMVNKAKAHGVRLRPHAKTAKSAAIMTRFFGKDTALTVSTLREAEYFAENGFSDLMYAVCISPDKFERVASLRKQGVDLTVVIDSTSVAKALSLWCREYKVNFSVAIEIDCDGHRAGLSPDNAELLQLAEILQQSPDIQFWGLMTHGGGSYSCASWSAVAQHAKQEKQALLKASCALSEVGITCQQLSLGSTPTVVAAQDFDGIDEIRPGVFVLFDLFQAQLGACQDTDIALSVLSTVTSHKPESNRIFLDAGGLALSKDRSTQQQAQDYGYGKLIKTDGSEYPQLVCVTQVNQEHGVVQLPEGLHVSDFPIGSRVRVLPNHACMTAAAYTGYHLFGEQPLQWLERCNGW